MRVGVVADDRCSMGSEHGESDDLDDDSAEHSDWGPMMPSTAIIKTVAARADVSPQALPPLYESVDPDALDRLFVSSGDKTTVSIDYAGYEVVVTGDGRVQVTDRA